MLPSLLMATATNGPPSFVLVGSDGRTYDVFDVKRHDGARAIVCTALLFDVGEKLLLQWTVDKTVTTAEATVVRHHRDGDGFETELELKAPDLASPPPTSAG